VKGFGQDEKFAIDLWDILQDFQPKWQQIKPLTNLCLLYEYCYQTNSLLKTHIALKLCDLILHALEKAAPVNLMRILKA
jgi:hypothetical protein